MLRHVCFRGCEEPASGRYWWWLNESADLCGRKKRNNYIETSTGLKIGSEISGLRLAVKRASVIKVYREELGMSRLVM